MDGMINPQEPTLGPKQHQLSCVSPDLTQLRSGGAPTASLFHSFHGELFCPKRSFPFAPVVSLPPPAHLGRFGSLCLCPPMRGLHRAEGSLSAPLSLVNQHGSPRHLPPSPPASWAPLAAPTASCIPMGSGSRVVAFAAPVHGTRRAQFTQGDIQSRMSVSWRPLLMLCAGPAGALTHHNRD